MPTQCNKGAIETLLKHIRPEVRKIVGYEAPTQGEVVAKLNQNENAYDLPKSLKSKILAEMEKTAWTRYPTYGSPVIQQKIADRFNLNPDEILIGHGSNQLLYTMTLTIISPGDKIVVNPPSFSLFELAAKIYRGKVVHIPQRHDFTYDAENLLKAVRTSKLTMICSPNNPTGKVMELELLERILNQTVGFVLWDEAYGEFWKKSAIPLINQHPNLLVLRTFSKALGMAGIRIGYLIGHSQVINEIRKVIVPYNINLFSNIAAIHIMNNSEWIENHVQKIIQERQKLYETLGIIKGITPIPSEANFITFRVFNGPEVLHQLRERDILIRNMGSYQMMDNCLRVTVGTPEENQIFLKAIREIVTTIAKKS